MLNYAEEMKRHEVLTEEQEQELAKRIQEGDKTAINELISSNLGLVMKIAHQYKNNGVEVEELIGAGNLGLVQAANNFKPGMGSKFGTFAQFYIRHQIKDTLSSLSGAIAKSIGKYNRTSNIMRKKEELGESATADEIAKACGGYNKKIVASVLRSGGNSKVSLNAKMDNDSETTYLDKVSEEEEDESYGTRQRNEMFDLMREGLCSLTEKERTIVSGLFSLNGERVTLMELGEALRLSAERVRQIKDNALVKLRSYIEQNA